LFPNGTLYRVVCGQVVYIRDRNGNLTNFHYENVWTYNSATGTCSLTGNLIQGRVTQIVDSIGRQIVITYGESPGTLGSDVIRFPGFQGTWRSITVQWSDLGGPSVLRADFQAQGVQTYPLLFPEFLEMANNQFRPAVVSSVTLPNNQTYQIQYNPYG